MKTALVCGVLVGIALGCGGGGGSGPGSGGTYSCSAGFPGADGGQGAAVVCVEGEGGSAADYDNNRKKCQAQGSSFVDRACSRSNALGGCRIMQAGDTITTWYYADGDSTAADIMKICAGLGQLGVQFVAP